MSRKVARRFDAGNPLMWVNLPFTTTAGFAIVS
jgi:hypothetical protein